MPRTRERLRRLRDYGQDRLQQYMRAGNQTAFWYLIRRGTNQAWTKLREGPYLEETRDGEQG